MILIFGGAFQGKLAYAQKKYNLKNSDISFCEADGQIDFDKRAVAYLNEYIKSMLLKGDKPIERITEKLPQLKDKIVICDDVCCGVVPVTHEERLYREAVGKSLQILSRASDEVYRIFCGIAEKLK